MKKYFYFREVTDEADDDGIDNSVTIPVNAITGVVPTNTGVTALDVYYKDQVEAMNRATLIVTRGKMQEVCAAIAAAANNYPHSTGLVVIADDVTTTNGASSIQGNDTSVSAVYTHPDITACSVATG